MTKNKENAPVKSGRKAVFFRLMKYYLRYKWSVAAAFLLMVGSNLFPLLGPWLSGKALDAIAAEGGVDFAAVANFCLYMAIFYVASAIFSYLLTVVMTLLSQRIIRSMRQDVFDKIVADYKAFITPLGIPDVQCIPLSALDGDNVVEKSDRTPWYDGVSLLEYLETVHIGNDHNLKDFRYPVQYVLRPNLDFRGFCGKVASGIIRKGDEVMALPSGKKSHIKSIVTYEGEIDCAFPPMSVTLTLEDEIDVSRGEMLVHPDNQPMIGRNFEAMLVWMDEEKMDLEKSFFLKQTTNTSRTRIDSIKYKVDINTMEHLSVENGRLAKEDVPMQLNQIARVVLTSSKEIFFDPYTQNKATGAFILIDPITNNTSAVGMIIDRVEDKDMHNTMELPVLDLPKLGIAPEHYEAIEKAVKDLGRQGIAIEIKK